MNKLIKNPQIILLICLFIFYGYYKMSHYFIIGSIQEEKIASIAIEKKDPSICSKIIKKFDLGPSPSESDLRDGCYRMTAEGLRDPTICENVSAVYRKGCYFKMAQFLNDESLCKSSNYEYQGTCYGGVAIQKKDTKICDRVEDESSRNSCYIDLNETIGNISICEDKIHITQDKDHCYYSVLQSYYQRNIPLTAKDEQICEKISLKEMKDDCIRYFNESIKR